MHTFPQTVRFHVVNYILRITASARQSSKLLVLVVMNLFSLFVILFVYQIHKNW